MHEKLKTGSNMKIVTSFLLIILALGCAKPPTSGNPHFVGRITAMIAKDGQSVLIAWKEAGLGDNVNVEYEASAAGTATYVCVNQGGQCPNADNKATVSGPVMATVTLSSGQNGTISGNLVLLPPSAGDFTCPGNQTMVLSEVSFTDIAIVDVTNSITGIASPDELSTVLFTCP